MKLAIIILILIVISVGCFLYAIKHAPIGWQDEEGFHEGKEGEKSSGKYVNWGGENIDEHETKIS